MPSTAVVGVSSKRATVDDPRLCVTRHLYLHLLDNYTLIRRNSDLPAEWRSTSFHVQTYNGRKTAKLGQGSWGCIQKGLWLVHPRSRSSNEERPTRSGAVLAAAARNKSQQSLFEAEKRDYDERVADWRATGCLLLLRGMGGTACPQKLEEALRARCPGPMETARWAWEPSPRTNRKHNGCLALCLESAEQRALAVAAIKGWVWGGFLIHMEGIKNRLPTTATAVSNLPCGKSTTDKADRRRPQRLTTPHTVPNIDLVSNSSTPPTSPVSVPCAAAAAVSDAADIATKASACAERALTKAKAATVRAFAAEAAGDKDTAAAANEDAEAADEEAKAAYGAAAAAARIASTYLAVIAVRGGCYSY
ncbi:hypothetical protein CCM_08332 [Cordyceps militaris CM01]|uniref:Uncharacterized protein n=1 Tax=Cordyceps militaris (strain CM01) TaxID=983644 RepID=G3JTE2_CORMM|nr:uncharacterized protein CCM_08332 [Cordyceps militaris CM01]EGX88289.1 hypothetical protein CCM_08332 [Cordyceps militaris CM01]